MNAYQKTALSMIGKVKAASEKMTETAHVALCNATVHAVIHGDVTLFDRLADAMGKAADRRAMLLWSREIGCATFDTKAGAFRLIKTRRAELEIAFNSYDELLESLLNGVKWHEYGRSVAEHARTINPLAMLESIIRQAEKAANDNSGKLQLADGAEYQIEAIKGLIAELKAA